MVYYGTTPLHLAAARGHLEVVRMLVEAGAKKDQQTKDDGSTALHFASARGHLHVVRFLVESGADDGITTCSGASALDLANQLLYLETGQYLAEVEARSLRNKRRRVSDRQ